MNTCHRSYSNRSIARQGEPLVPVPAWVSDMGLDWLYVLLSRFEMIGSGRSA